MSGRWVQLLPQALTCGPNAEMPIQEGDLNGYGEVGFHDVAMRLDFEVTGTASGATAAMTLTQRKTFLNTLALDLRFDMGGATAPAVVQSDEENKFSPSPPSRFDDLRRRALRTLRQE